MKSRRNAKCWLSIMKSWLADNRSEQPVNAVCKSGDPGEVYRKSEPNCGRWPYLMQCYSHDVAAVSCLPRVHPAVAVRPKLQACHSSARTFVR
jgi:hypothetical protein